MFFFSKKNNKNESPTNANKNRWFIFWYLKIDGYLIISSGDSFLAERGCDHLSIKPDITLQQAIDAAGTLQMAGNVHMATLEQLKFSACLQAWNRFDAPADVFARRVHGFFLLPGPGRVCETEILLQGASFL